MTLLAPIMLALGSAVVVPIAIHLLRRRSGRTVTFPAARYIQRAEREHSRELRLRNLAVMLLRVTALALIAVAAARPVAGTGGQGYSRTALALFIDNSMSSGVVAEGTLVLDRLKQAAILALRGLEPGDRAWLITADGRVVGGSTDGILESVSRLNPLPMRADQAAVIRAAVAAARSFPEANPVVAVLTDAQQTQWSDSSDARGVAVRLYVPRFAQPENRHILDARPVPARWTGAGAVDIAIASPDAAAFVASLSDGSIIRGTAPGGAGRRVRVRFQPRVRGWIKGSVAVERDELPADDVRHFAIWVGDLPRARADASAGTFASAALEALAAGGRIVSGSGTVISAADVARELPAILVAPTDPVRIGTANRQLALLGVPWRFGARRPETGAVRGDTSLLRGTISVRSRYDLVREGSSGGPTAILATAGSEPWLVAGENYALFASPLEPSWSSLPVSPTFVPLLESLLSVTLSSRARAQLYATPYSRVTLPAWADEIETPSGDHLKPSGWKPLEPGVYYLLSGRDRVGAVVVNVPEAESDPRRHSLTRLASFFPGTRVSASEAPAAWSAGLFTGRTGKSLIVPALWGALLLLTVEMFVRTGATLRKR